jgi:hypothetical protein
MRRNFRPIVAAFAIALAGTVAGCASFDPTDMLDFLDTKKKLPGDRRPVFPNGVPGIEEGVPREYLQGQNTDPTAAQPQDQNAAANPQGTQPGAQQPGQTAADETPAEPVKPPKNTKVASRRRITAIPKDSDTPAAAQTTQQAAPQASPPPFPAPLPSQR